MSWFKYEDKTINLKAGDVITVTDPCYDRDSTGQTDVHLPVGEYECYYDEVNEGCWGNRVARIAIVQKGKDYELDMDRYVEHCVGSAPVDAGLCGFFINKPDYDDEAWMKFCDNLDNDVNTYHTDEGFFTSSGYGDGEYDISIIDCGGVIGLMVTFIEDEEDWEDEEEDYEEDEE